MILITGRASGAPCPRVTLRTNVDEGRRGRDGGGTKAVPPI